MFNLYLFINILSLLLNDKLKRDIKHLFLNNLKKNSKRKLPKHLYLSRYLFLQITILLKKCHNFEKIMTFSSKFQKNLAVKKSKKLFY